MIAFESNDLRDWATFILALSTFLVAVTGFVALFVSERRRNGKHDEPPEPK